MTIDDILALPFIASALTEAEIAELREALQELVADERAAEREAEREFARYHYDD